MPLRAIYRRGVARRRGRSQPGLVQLQKGDDERTEHGHDPRGTAQYRKPVCEVSATSFTTDAAVGGVQVQLLLRLMVKGMDPTGLKGRVDPAPTSAHHAPFR